MSSRTSSRPRTSSRTPPLLKQTSIISIEKVTVLHWIAVAPYFRSPKRNHLFLAGKTLEISMKTLFIYIFSEIIFWPEKNLEISMKTFFLRSPVFGRRNFTTLQKILGFTKPDIRQILAGHGRRKKIWVNYNVFIWQGVKETKKVKSPCTILW